MRLHILASFLCIGIAAGARKVSDDAFRSEFMRIMEESLPGEQRKTDLTKRLLNVARPAAPEFMQVRALEDYQGYSVNLTNYALKYLGCSNIHTFSDDLAQSGYGSDSVLALNQFVVVRLCPRDECSNYHKYGCNSDFGDYLIPMEDYLQIMKENYFEQYEQYCETCAACNGQSYGNGNYGYYQYGNNNGRRLADDDGHNYDDGYNNNDDNANACDYYDCDNYKRACKNYYTQEKYMEEYFQCGQFYLGNKVAYLGPHCMSDGKTIGIGIYRDQYCNEYNAPLTDISASTGMDLSDEYLKFYYPKSCISCLASDGYSLNNNQYNQVSDVCGILYEDSAKCNKYLLGTNGNINSYAQEENEEQVCNFISNLVKKHYNEDGEIVLSYGFLSYIPDVTEMTEFQKAAMTTSVLLVVGLSAYAVYLYRDLNKKRFTWAPRLGYLRGPNAQPKTLARMNSGIIQGRSRSGNSLEISGGTMA